jgi:hypothetical protein
MTPLALWNSLEVAKVLVAGLTPVFVAVAGFYLNRRLKSLEQAQWSQQKVIERRITAYDQLAPLLNRLFCFFCYVGSWKESNPPEIISLKRKIDHFAYVSAPLFDGNFLRNYEALMDQCFSTFGKWGEDAKLRSLADRREQVAGADWDSSWNSCFSERAKSSEPDDIKVAYAGLMAYLAESIGAKEVDKHLLGSTRIPGNFDARAAGVVSRIRRPGHPTAPTDEKWS